MGAFPAWTVETESASPLPPPRERSASFIFALWGIFVRLNGFFILDACNETQTACRDNAEEHALRVIDYPVQQKNAFAG